MTAFNQSSDFYDQTFSDLILNEETVANKTFENCQFIRCQFNQATLSKCKWVDCSFEHCQLNNATITGSLFNTVSFKSCKLLGIDWTQAHWPLVVLGGMLTFDECDLSHNYFFGLTLCELVLTECKAHELDCREADCREADFSGTDLSRALFQKTNLTNANFNRAFNYHINVNENKIKGAKFSVPEVLNLLAPFEIEIED